MEENDEKKKSNNNEDNIIKTKYIDIYFDNDEEINIPINRGKKKSYEEDVKQYMNRMNDDKKNILIINDFKNKKIIDGKNKIKEPYMIQEKNNNSYDETKKDMNIYNKEQKNIYNKIHDKKKNNNIENNNETNDTYINKDNKEYEIPIHRNKSRNKINKNVTDHFYGHNQFDNEHREYGDDDDDDFNKKMHILDIFKYHDFPMNMFGKKKNKSKTREKKFVVEFVDTYNDDYVKKNLNNNLIFESIGVCKGISFLHINKNINISCIGSQDNNAFYFYKMIPFEKLYTKDTMDKILSKKYNGAVIDEGAQTNVLRNKNKTGMNTNENNNKNISNNNIYDDHNNIYNFFSKNYNSLKNYFFKKRKKEKKTLYNDLYLTPYEKNLKSSLCIGTHIYSKERAVKKCFGLLIEQNVYTVDQPQDDNASSVNKNLENLYFDFPYNKNQIIFKPVFYPYKNVEIINNSFQNYIKNIKWDKLNKLKDAQFYYDTKNKIFNFSKEIYITTKSAIRRFDSPADFIIQTTNRMKDINVQMKKICEKSFNIVHDSILKLSKMSKAS
ncbi:conserved Plasmodium protein, unknown function [Plasmodium sp. gorilla clade G1]|nr:conserved Plasmodium protein, unknown function [Plasmodium sp. gorilla clade G1]